MSQVNVIAETVNTDGHIKLTRAGITRYGRTSKGRGTIRLEVTYSVYVVTELGYVDLYRGTRKAQALATYKRVLKLGVQNFLKVRQAA